MSIGTTATLKTDISQKLGSIDTPDLKPDDTALGAFVDFALRKYNQLRPQVKVHEAPGDASTRRFVLDDLTGWAPSFSAVNYVASVSGKDTDDENESRYSAEDLVYRRTAADKDALFLPVAVATGNDLRIVYRIPHTIHASTEANTTIPTQEKQLFVTLGAATGALWIARKAGDLQNTVIGASEVDYRRLREHWSQRARELDAEASELIDPKVTAGPGVGKAVPWKTKSRMTKLKRVSH
jgi:hypothetical protein